VREPSRYPVIFKPSRVRTLKSCCATCFSRHPPWRPEGNHSW